MKTREELEKMFEEKVTSTRVYDEYWTEITDEVKQFIFNDFITTVLKDILPKEKLYILKWYDEAIKEIKQKAKELWFII